MEEEAGDRERPRALAEAWSLLRRNRDFRLFYMGELVSFAGDWFLIVALSGLVLHLTHSAELVAAVFIAYNLPYGIVSFVGGPLADRFDRRKMMIWTNLVMGVLALGFFLVHGKSDLWIVFVLASAISAVSALFEPASSAAVPNLVDEEDLAAANVLNGSAWGTMLAVGAGLGGIVVAAYGNEVGYLVDALSFFFAAAVMVPVRRATSHERDPDADHPGILDATREAVSFSRRDRRVLDLYAIRLGAGFALGMVALLPVLAVNTFHSGDRGMGLLFGMRGVGSLIGPFLVRPLLRRKKIPLAAAIGFLGVFSALYGLIAWMPGLYLAGMLALLATISGSSQWALVTFSYQAIVPDNVLGRIFGLDGALITVTLAMSNALCGRLATVWGDRAAMTVVAAGVCAYAFVLWVVARRSVRA
jgi:MFS family permease